MSHINRKLIGKEAHELTLLDLQDLMRAIHNPATVNKGAKGRVQLLTNHTNSNRAPIVVVLDNNFKTNTASITKAYALTNLAKVVPETSQDVLYTNNRRLADFLSDYSESKNRGFGIALFAYPEYDSSSDTIKYTQEKTNPKIEFDVADIRKIIENTKSVINKTNVSRVDFQAGQQPTPLTEALESPAYNQREGETDEQYKERLREEVFATALESNGEQYLKDLGFTAQEAKTFLQKVHEFLAEIVDWLRGKKGLQVLSVDEINKLSIREFLDRSTTSMMLGEFKDPSQTSALTPNRDVQVYITPATVRNFNEETLRLKELTNEYNNVAKEISQGNLENQEEFTNSQYRILDAYQEHIKEKVSKIRGVNVNFNQPYLGSWQGNYEPSLNMTLSISPNADTGAISGLLFDIAENTSQDAFILEERSEIEDRTPLTEFDEAGMMHYPQIRVNFDSQLSVAEKSIIAQRLKNNGVEEFSIDGDYFIVSIIDLNSETYEQKEEFYAEMATAITTPFRGEGERVGTNKVRDVQEHSRKSKYVGARNEGDEQSQTRGYDRSDLFETQSPNINFQINATEQELQQIKEQAIANGTFMKAPNGKKSNLTEEQWVAVRTERFKKWFGDWELAGKTEPILNGKPVSELTGKEFAKSDKSILDQVGDFFKSIGGKVDVKGIGQVVLDRRSVKDSLSHGIGRSKASAFKAIPEILTKGQIVDRQANWKGRGYDSYTISAPITINGERFVAFAIVNEATEQGNHRFYLHEVVLQKSLQSEEFKTGMVTGSPQGDIAKIVRNIVTAQDNISKVVDENGEPLVVYHGTEAEFTEFEPTKPNFYQETEGWYFFTDKKESAKTFGKNVMPVFLNIDNPTIETTGHFNTWNLYDDEGNYGFIAPNTDTGNGGVANQYVVENPNQIKSATDNVGTYSEQSNDIRFSIKSNETPKPVPVNVAKEAINIMKEVAGFTNKSRTIFDAGIDFIKTTEWYENFSPEQQAQVDTPTFRNYPNI